MRLIAAIAFKDLRRLRWWLALWLVLNAALVATILEPHMAPPSWWFAGLFDNLLYVAALPVSTIALVFAALRDDAPFDPDAFWVTRPVSGWTLAAAKGLVIVASVWLVPLLFGWVLWHRLGFSGAEQLHAAWTTLTLQVGISLTVLPFAALWARRNPLRPWLGLTVVVVGTIFLNARLTGVTNNGFNHLPLGLSESRQDVVILLYWVAVVTATVVAYRTRRLGRVVAIWAGGATLIVLTTFAWPWNFDRAKLFGGASAAARPVSFSLSPADAHPDDAPGWVRLAGSIELSGNEYLDAWRGGGLVEGVWSSEGRTARVEGKFVVGREQTLRDRAAAIVEGADASPKPANLGLDVFVVGGDGAALPLPPLAQAAARARLDGTLLFRPLVAEPVARVPLDAPEARVMNWRIRIEPGIPRWASSRVGGLLVRALSPVWGRQSTEFLLVDRKGGRVAHPATYLQSDLFVYGVDLKRCAFALPVEATAGDRKVSVADVAGRYDLAVVTFARGGLQAVPVAATIDIPKR